MGLNSGFKGLKLLVKEHLKLCLQAVTFDKVTSHKIVRTWCPVGRLYREIIRWTGKGSRWPSVHTKFSVKTGDHFRVLKCYRKWEHHRQSQKLHFFSYVRRDCAYNVVLWQRKLQTNILLRITDLILKVSNITALQN